jgi:hypothetical protein
MVTTSRTKSLWLTNQKQSFPFTSIALGARRALYPGHKIYQLKFSSMLLEGTVCIPGINLKAQTEFDTSGGHYILGNSYSSKVRTFTLFDYHTSFKIHTILQPEDRVQAILLLTMKSCSN